MNKQIGLLSRSVVAAHGDLNACTAQVTTIAELLTASTDLSRRISQEADEWVNQAVRADAPEYEWEAHIGAIATVKEALK